MFFGTEEDDQDFMSPGGGKKLASLFGVDQASNQGGNESLTYTAPKQPKKKEATSQGGQPSILFATAVNAYKYVDGQYASQGKLGAAILANQAVLDFRILLYVSKQQQVTHAKITSAFTYTVQANHYANFYDDQRQSWSLLFDSENNAVQFAKHIGLAKCNSIGGELNSLISQDLRTGDGGVLEVGDSVEVKYTGWLLTNHTFGQEFDSNVKTDKQFRFKVGKGKVIKGWDTGVVGMKKGSKRLLVVPPTLGYGSQGAGNKIPPNSTLIFEIEVIRVKLAKSESSPSPSPVPNAASTPSPGPDAEIEEHTVKGRTKSISEQLSQGGGGSNKAKLISRMAKMGQPMLPLVGATVAQTESDEEPVPESPVPVAAAPTQPTTQPVVKPVAQHPAQPTLAQPAQPVYQQPAQVMQPPISQPAFLQNIPGAQQLSVYQPQQNLLQQQQAALLQQQQMQMLNMQQQGFQPAPGYTGMPGTSMPNVMPPTGMAGDTTTPVMLSETRQQNTELKSSIGKISEKVDHMLEKVEFIHRQSSGALALQNSAPNMEASVLMHNIQRIVQENDRLRTELYEKSSKIEQQNKKISELIQSNQMVVEKNQSMLEQRNEGFQSSASQSQARVLHLEKEKVHLTTELSNVTSQLSSLQLEMTDFRKKEIELQQKLDSSSRGLKREKEELEMLKTQHQEDENKIEDISKSLKTEKQKRKQLESQISQIQEEYQDVKSANQTLEKNLSDRKRKAGEEKRQLEEEFEESKGQLEQEIQSLRDKLRKAKSSTDTVAAQQASQIEQELNEEWKMKCDKLLAAAQDKHSRALSLVQEEKQELEGQIQQLENKIQTLKSSSGSSEESVRRLQEQLDEMSAWQDKYNKLRTQATSMKEKYEERISELEEEKEEAETGKEEAEQQVRKWKEESLNKMPYGDSSQIDISREIKKIMNTVYQRLRGEFDDENNYSGKEVLSAILNAIKETTLNLMQQSASPKEESQSEEDEEEDDEEEEEEEEEEVDEEEDKEENDTEEVKTDQDFDAQGKEIPPSPQAEAGESTELEESREEGKSEDKTEEKEEVVNTSVTVDTKDIPAVVGEEAPSANDTKPLGDNDTRDPSDNDTNNPEASEIKEPNDSNTKAPSVTKSNNMVENKTKEKTFDDFIVPSISSMEPPPMDDSISDNSEEDKKDDDKPLFGDDDNIADTFGEDITKPKTVTKPVKKDLLNDDDVKAKAPPPLFPDDDDDDEDLDWLS